MSPTGSAAPSGAAFTFGEPMPVLSQRELLDCAECWSNGKWYEPPISPEGLARAFRCNPHHSSALFVKRNLLVSTYEPHPALPVEAFARFALEYLIFGNAYLERVPARPGHAPRFLPLLAKDVRRGVAEGRYYRRENGTMQPIAADVFHLIEPDLNQEIYGVPEYLSALQAAFLNESATLFRRRYYLNGSHAGFILYMSDAAQNEADIDALRAALRESKGPGNFRNLFLYAPSGKKDGIQVIPISEVAAKDDFLRIKQVSRDDVLAAHRVPPQLLGLIPGNAGGFGDVGKARAVFHANEILPLQARFETLNERVGFELIRFAPLAE